MSSGGKSGSGLSFVSESEISERRQRRQEEYEKNRTQDMPLEAPEEPYDSRTLYQRLKEQKDLKDEEFEESRKLKNLIKGLDSEEIHFLEMVDNNKIQLETQRLQEETQTLEEYKKAMNELNNEEQEKRFNDLKKTNLFTKNETNCNKPTKKSTQSALLANVIRKRTQSETSEGKTPKKLRSDDTTAADDSKTSDTSSGGSEKVVSNNASVKCIGVLPGLGHYGDSDSSDSDNSSNSDIERIDFSLIVRHKRQTPDPAAKTPSA